MTINDEPPKRPRGRPRKSRPENPDPPRPVGRPSLGDDAKTQNVTIRLSPEEYALWKQLASEQGMNIPPETQKSPVGQGKFGGERGI